MRRLAIATFSRAEYAASLALMRAAAGRADVEALLLAGGSHLDPAQGRSIDLIRADGLDIAETAPFLPGGDDGAAAAACLASATAALALSLARLAPDILVLAGDRYELLAAAGSALLLGIPVAHISGGEVTEGALDEQVRHAVSKLSHLHFVAMEAFRRRLIRMGEEPWRVFATGDPALDLVAATPKAGQAEIEAVLGLPLAAPILLVACHPATRGGPGAGTEIDALLAALEGHPGTLVLTGANLDPGGAGINRAMAGFAARHDRAVFRQHLGQRVFHGLLACADVLVGNSSSGLWEAPSFALPVVNIGDRQRGRFRAANVIDAPAEAGAIRAALDRALDPGFSRGLEGMVNPYGDGRAAERIIATLAATAGGDALLRKAFHDSEGDPTGV